MKNPIKRIKAFSALVFFFAMISCDSNQSTIKEIDKNIDQIQSETISLGYDSLRAAKLGADQYGMKKYVMAFLKKGPNRDLDEKRRHDLQQAHMANITYMAEQGKLVLAGPFLDNGELRGIYIFDTGSIEEAQKLTNSDPAIQAGSLVMELKEWYGSAALMEVNEIHNAIAKINI